MGGKASILTARYGRERAKALLAPGFLALSLRVRWLRIRVAA
jgi:hypothetical protein